MVEGSPASGGKPLARFLCINRMVTGYYYFYDTAPFSEPLRCRSFLLLLLLLLQTQASCELFFFFLPFIFYVYKTLTMHNNPFSTYIYIHIKKKFFSSIFALSSLPLLCIIVCNLFGGFFNPPESWGRKKKRKLHHPAGSLVEGRRGVGHGWYTHIYIAKRRIYQSHKKNKKNFFLKKKA